MMNQPDTTRFQPTESALKIILNNKYFPDDLLDDSQSIELICTNQPNPILHFKFKQAYQDFRVLLDAKLRNNLIQGWLKKNPIEIQLILSDPIFADQLKCRTFPIEASTWQAFMGNTLLQPPMPA
jgi:hypothetical protein